MFDIRIRWFVARTAYRLRRRSPRALIHHFAWTVTAACLCLIAYMLLSMYMAVTR